MDMLHRVRRENEVANAPDALTEKNVAAAATDGAGGGGAASSTSAMDVTTVAGEKSGMDKIEAQVMEQINKCKSQSLTCIKPADRGLGLAC